MPTKLYHTHLIHHHITLTLPPLSPTQLTLFNLEQPAKVVRIHFWTETSGFPKKALRFCAHLYFESTARYDNTSAYPLHRPENTDAEVPCRVACGEARDGLTLELNRAVWEELQHPVLSLTALRAAVAARIERLLQESLESI